jgi:hypothetical protein
MDSERANAQFPLACPYPIADHGAMTRCRLLLLALLVALVLLGVGVYALWPRAGITRTNASAICDGMTRAEVAAIMGGPPGDYHTPGRECSYDYSFLHPGNSTSEEWIGDEGLVLVAFDAEGRAVANLFVEVHQEETVFDKFRRWIGL